MLSVITDAQAGPELRLDLDELAREGARRMLAQALEAEVDAYLAAHADQVDERGRRLVVRNGHAPPRTLAMGAGAVEVTRPRVDDRRSDPATGARVRFASAILPRWVRRSPKVAEVLPLLYLHGLSTGDFAPALAEFFGSGAGLSASAVGRLAEQWQAEHAAFAQRDLSRVDDVYCWADGIHFTLLHAAPGRRAAVRPGHRRRPGRRDQGAGRGHRRHARVDRGLGGAAAILAPPGDARPGPHGRRRRPRTLGGTARGLPAHPRAALLGP
jgi:transposase-like protein